MINKTSYSLGKHLFKIVEKILYVTIGFISNLGFKDKANYIGTFILIYLGLGGGFIAFALFIGINPTLIVSVVGAPIWIGIVFLTNRLTKIAIGLKDIDDYKPRSRKKKEI